MATVNKRFLKRTTLNSNFAKRSRKAGIEVVDVTSMQEYLRKDWEELAELHPEYLQPNLLIKTLITDIVHEIPYREWLNLMHKLKISRISLHYLAYQRRRWRKDLSLGMCNLKVKRKRLAEEKSFLIKEIHFYKSKLGKQLI